MWYQRAGRGRYIVWDHHVILLAANPWQIWDLDTTLAFPVAAHDYLRKSFPDGVPAPFVPMFRIVDADQFIETFASDRSHMLLSNGRYRKPPPPWPPIRRKNVSNLMRFVDIADAFIGDILTLEDLYRTVA